ncbi:MAG: CPBP family intramembrane metalloprotease [Leptolyngbyaceae cyanobacterium SL_1_1]|nr:CPBP family intramembrane metalloprotease [Leptolyngbyaceae cyanobacterium RM1_1_2]NJO10424.1 CPBP family intramembrane metalloprotease [Leptolyngbyaceae cyanobacterium SL_1_1]
MLLLLWAPIAIAVRLLATWYQSERIFIAALILLYFIFISLLRGWGRHVYGLARPLSYYGLTFSTSTALWFLSTFLVGAIGVGILFTLQVSLGWAEVVPAAHLGRIAAEGLITAIGIGWAEEILFRGWLLGELERDYSPAVALFSSSTLFAMAHFIRPFSAILATWPQFFGLLLLGLALVWAKRATTSRHQLLAGDLAAPGGLHAGLVWAYYVVDVGDLVVSSEQVPTWITGVGGNPLAGGLGLLLLSAIAFSFRSIRWQSVHR